MLTADIDYSFEGIALKGFIAREEGGPAKRAGVLVIHDAGGLSENIKEKTRALAKLGYVAFALDMFGGGMRVSDGMQRLGALVKDIPRWRGLTQAGLAVLASQEDVDPARLGAIGYCFGGTTVYELARSGTDVKAVVGFHSGLSPSSGEAKNIKGKLLCLIGAEDPLIPAEARLAFEKELRDAGVDWQMNIYGRTGHSFTNPGAGALNRPGFFYQADSDARSWAEMKRLFEETLAAHA